MVLNVFGSRDLPREPQETQEPPKRHPRTSKTPCKKMPKKIPINASVVKIALSRRSHFKRLMEKIAPKFALFLNHLLHIFFTTF